jgi:hypothetical protein
VGLEAPLALLGLLTAAIPFLVHRLRRTDPRRRVLPTFALLQKVEAARRRTRGLTDLLLLAARVALLVFAALALGAPFVIARVPFGDGRPAATAIVIDDSASMLRGRAGEPTLLAHALARAREVSGSLPPGSEVALVLAGAPARVLFPRADDTRSAERTLQDVPATSARGTDLRGAVALALQELRGSRHDDRRLLVLSDFAPHPAVATDAWKLGGVQLFVEPLGDGTPGTNVAVVAADASRAPERESLAVTVELHATGAVPARVPVELRRGGAVLATGEAALTNGAGTARLTLPVPPPGGDPTAEVRALVDDDLDADDALGLLLAPRGGVRLLAVNGDPRPASDQDEMRYLTRALELVPHAEGAVDVRQADADALQRHDLAEFDVILLANVVAPDAALAERLGVFVRAGGGLVIAAGEHVAPRAYAAALRDLLPCHPNATERGRSVGFAPVAPSSLLPHGSLGLAQAAVETRLVLEAADDAEVPLRFADGAPAIVSRAVGRGRVSVLATTLDADWTDLPLRPGFLPLAWGLVREAAQRVAQPVGPVRGGETVAIAVPPGAKHVEVVSPDASRHPFEPRAGQATVAFAHTRAPGAYRVLVSHGPASARDVPHAAFVVRAPTEESVLGPRPALAPSRVTTHGSDLGNTVRRSLSPLLFLACAALALIEAALRLRKR